MFCTCIVVVDLEVDVQNVREVAWKALNNIDLERDSVCQGSGRVARPCQPPGELRIERNAQAARRKFGELWKKARP